MKKGSPEMNWYCRIRGEWLVANLKGRKNRDESFSGSYLNRGEHGRFVRNLDCQINVYKC